MWSQIANHQNKLRQIIMLLMELLELKLIILNITQFHNVFFVIMRKKYDIFVNWPTRAVISYGDMSFLELNFYFNYHKNFKE